MATYGERIRELRKNRHMSQQDLADLLDVSKVAVSQYEREVRKPDLNTLTALSDIFNVSSDYILGNDDVTVRFLDTDDIRELDSKSRKIPVFGRVAAGVPMEAIEDILDWEEISGDLPGEYFGLKVKGDSMSPRIMEGDVLIVHAQPDAESGDIVIAQINGDQATCKKLIKHRNGISLLPLNLDYSVMYFSADEAANLPVRIIGKVVENRQKF